MSSQRDYITIYLTATLVIACSIFVALLLSNKQELSVVDPTSDILASYDRSKQETMNRERSWRNMGGFTFSNVWKKFS
jgi:hypothetical protein